jgi:hypothetical protein
MDEWKRGHFALFFKKWNRRDCSNYRGTNLLKVNHNVYTMDTTLRMNTVIECVLLEEQYGFCKERPCSDCIFVIEQLI